MLLRQSNTKKMFPHRAVLAAGLAITCLGIGRLPASADDVNFAGKTIKLILGQAAGGGADASARLVAAYIGKFLPGNPVIVVQNVPGANGIIASNQLTHQSAPDGLTFFAGSASQVVAAAEKNPNAKYDPTLWEFVGAVQNPGTVLVAAKSAVPRLTNPSAEPVIMAQVGVARPGALFTIWGKEFLGWNVRQVTGYRGSRWAPEGVSVRNPAFDVTPAELITGIITERGVVKKPNRERVARLTKNKPTR